MIEKGFKGLRNRKKLQEAVNDDVEDRQEAKAHIAKVNWQVLRLKLHGRVDLFSKALKVELLWVFLIKESLSPQEFSVVLLDSVRWYLLHMKDKV